VYPNRSEEDKAILARKEKEDLDKKVKFLSEDNKLKAERYIIVIHAFHVLFWFRNSSSCTSVGW